MKFTPAERVLEIALEQQRRGADICKIVVGADNMAEQIENLRIINLLKENLKIPFLFLCGGESHIIRRIGGEIGCCMYLAVHEHDELATPAQPLLRDLTSIVNGFRGLNKG
jgi:3-dehydroquinate dehydratase